MICIVTRQFSLNRFILLLIGLWPYQHSKLAQLQIILCLGILISSVVYQFAVFVSADCTIELILKVFSIALFFSMYVIDYIFFRVSKQTIKWSLEQLQRICNELKDEKEVDIMKEYGENARRFTAILMSLHMCNIIAIISLPLVLYILDIVLLINEYHPRRVMQMLIPSHFIGRENYFYLIILHSGAALCIGGTTLIATEMMFISYIKHACGMFRIASYRIEKAMMVNCTLQNVSMKNETIMFTEITHAIEIHRKAIKFTALFFSGFQQSRFVLIVIAVITLSLNLYGISEVILLGDNIEEFLMHSIIVVAIFIYLFLINYAGQEFTDHNTYIFSTVYNVRWYVAPLHIQKMILFLLRKGSKTISLNFGVIFALSLDLFVTLTKASISYFTIVCSMRESLSSNT